RLAGAGRPDAEHHGVPVDRVDIPLLVQRLRPDGAAAPGDDVQAEHVGRTLGGAGLEHRDDPGDLVRGQPLTAVEHGQQLLEHPHRERVVGRAAGDGDLVAADMHVAGQLGLDQQEQLVAGPEQAHHRLLVGNYDLGFDCRAGLCGCGGIKGGIWQFAGSALLSGQAATADPVYPAGGRQVSPKRPAPKCPSGTPPSTCRWTWNTVCPASGPVLNTSRYPDSSRPSAAATAAPSATSAASRPASAAASVAAFSSCSPGTTTPPP